MLSFSEVFLIFCARVQSLILYVADDQWVEVSILRGNKHFEIDAMDGTLIASGSVVPLEGELPEDMSVVNNDEEVTVTMQKDEIYALLRKHGYTFPQSLQPLKTLGITSTGKFGFLIYF